MPHLVLVRIDERLIHGQVLTQWLKTSQANLVVVANDKVSEDPLRQSLMNVAIPVGVGTRYFSIEKTINTLHKASDQQHIMLLVESPQDVLKLVKGGIPILELNVGNMHFKEGKTQVSPSVALDESDIRVFKELKALGLFCTIQRMPSENSINLNEIVDKL